METGSVVMQTVLRNLSDAQLMDELAHIPAGYGYVHVSTRRLGSRHHRNVAALASPEPRQGLSVRRETIG